MKRIKLFSKKPRLSLFGDIAGQAGSDTQEILTSRREAPAKTLVCADCGFQITDPSTGSTSELCPRCGSSRFEYLETMPSYGQPGSIGPKQEVPETDKAFSKLERKNRISLFSGTKKTERISLFSALTHRQPNTTGEGTDNGTVAETVFKCTDCGHEFALKCDTVSGTRCPNCGGNRVVKVSANSDSDKTGEFLGQVAGQTLTLDEATKAFSECGATGTLQDLIDSGYATMTENSEVSFSDTAESEYSIFSDLVISVAKELELPVLTGCQEDQIGSISSLSPKGILLIKRAHRLVPHPLDAGIAEGIPSEELKRLGQDGNVMTFQEFQDYLRSKYNDAPENLTDLLCNKGIVKISGSRIA